MHAIYEIGSRIQNLIQYQDPILDSILFHDLSLFPIYQLILCKSMLCLKSHIKVVAIMYLTVGQYYITSFGLWWKSSFGDCRCGSTWRARSPPSSSRTTNRASRESKRETTPSSWSPQYSTMLCRSINTRTALAALVVVVRRSVSLPHIPTIWTNDYFLKCTWFRK